MTSLISGLVYKLQNVVALGASGDGPSDDTASNGSSDNEDDHPNFQRISDRLLSGLSEQDEADIHGYFLHYATGKHLKKLLDFRCSLGYSLLQHSVNTGSIILSRCLLSLGADPNNHLCSHPLHLCCSSANPNLDLFHILLSHDAKLDICSAMCYPEAHNTSTCQRFALTSLLIQPTNQCRHKASFPTDLLIEQDNSDWLQIILARHADWLLKKPLFSLQQFFSQACKFGSIRCATYILDHFYYSDDVTANSSSFSSVFGGMGASSNQGISLNSFDERQMTPLMYTICARYELFQLLLIRGASVTQLSGKNETILHVLFKNLRSTDQLLEKVKLALGSGLEEMINERDSDGNTILHCIVFHVNNNLAYMDFDNVVVISDTSAATIAQQNQYQRTILEAMELVLKYNCNPRLENDKGVTPFNQVLSNFYTFLTFNVEPNFHDPMSYFYVFDMDILADCIELLLTYGANAAECTLTDQLPLKLLFHGILNISPIQYHRLQDGFLKCVRLLCRHGTVVNFTMKNHQGNTISLLATLAESILNTVGIGAFVYDRTAKTANVEFLDQCVRILCQYGLKLNDTVSRVQPFMHGGRGNALAEFIPLCRVLGELADLRHLFKWVETLLHYGANPNIQSYPAEPTIVHSQSSIFLKANHTYPLNLLLHICRENGYRLLNSPHLDRLLLAILSVTKYSITSEIIRDFTAKLQREDPKFPLLPKLRMVISQPTSLKQFCRSVLYLRLLQQPQFYYESVQSLHLPYQLTNYLIYFEP